MDIVTKSEKIYAMVTVSRTWFNLWIDWGYLRLAQPLAQLSTEQDACGSGLIIVMPAFRVR